MEPQPSQRTLVVVLAGAGAVAAAMAFVDPISAALALLLFVGLVAGWWRLPTPPQIPRLVASQPETEWDAQQRGWMLALAEYRASRCPCGCGHNVNETTAKQGTHAWKPRVVRCLARDAMVSAQQRASNEPGDRAEARLWWVDKVR